jgi:hypothetical protein
MNFRPQIVQHEQERPTALQHVLNLPAELQAAGARENISRTAANFLCKLLNKIQLPAAQQPRSARIQGVSVVVCCTGCSSAAKFRSAA